MGRVFGFDLLRGVCAILVALTHMEVLGHNAGLYPVYIFFVLSGASLYVTYRDRISSTADVQQFFVNRLFRLVPLYGITIVVFWQMWGRAPNDSVLLNASLMFGLGNPGHLSIIVGGWSIGIEFAFYMAFPIIAALISSRAWWAVVAVAVIAQYLFINQTLRGTTLGDAWPLYIHPLGFLGYFVVGCAIARFTAPRWSSWWLVAAGAIVAGIMLYPTASSTAALVRSTGAVLFAASCLAVFCAALARSSDAIARVSIVLGNASYGVYLLHTPMFHFVKRNAPDLDRPVTVVVALALTICVALLLDRYLETPIRTVGRSLLAGRRLTSRPAAAQVTCIPAEPQRR